MLSLLILGSKCLATGSVCRLSFAFLCSKGACCEIRVTMGQNNVFKEYPRGK
jgi:hypothetical protein